jgi:hypothetical protein
MGAYTPLLLVALQRSANLARGQPLPGVLLPADVHQQQLAEARRRKPHPRASLNGLQLLRLAHKDSFGLSLRGRL